MATIEVEMMPVTPFNYCSPLGRSGVTGSHSWFPGFLIGSVLASAFRNKRSIEARKPGRRGREKRTALGGYSPGISKLMIEKGGEKCNSNLWSWA
jgi:hypothetical protein